MSFLRSQQTPQSNPLAGIMQGIVGEDGSTAPGPTNILQNVNPITQSANTPRRSVLDTIGRLSDVFAKVGGADALYQPSLDTREDRTIALGDHSRAVDMDKLKLATAQGTLDDAGRVRLAQAVRGTQALLAANPQADASKIFPLLAARAGVDPQQAATLSGQLAQDPTLLEGLAGMDDTGDKYGGSVIYATGPDGKITAFQPNLKGGKGRQVLPDGFTAIDPAKAVNLGGTTALVGTRSGNVNRILPNTARPDTIANNQTQRDIAAGRNQTQLTIAGMPARGKQGAAGPTPEASNVLALLDNIQSGFGDLNRMKALPGSDGGAVGNVLSALGRTGIGQAIGEQAGSPSAQKRLEIAKNVSALQQAMLKSLPASATRTKFEQEMLARGLPDPAKMSYGTAQTVIGQLRESYMRAIAASQPRAAPGGGKSSPRPTARTPIRPRAGGNGGWSVVGVK